MNVIPSLGDKALKIDNVDTSRLNAVMTGNDGKIKPVPSILLKSFDRDVVLKYALEKGIYQFATVEMIDWLKDQIGERTAIEICAGNGTIGRSLGIPITDSYMQQLPEIEALYLTFGQPIIKPPADVQKFEAMAAVEYFNPIVVIGAYATQKYANGDEHRKIGSSVYGVDHRSIIDKCETFILFIN